MFVCMLYIVYISVMMSSSVSSSGSLSMELSLMITNEECFSISLQNNRKLGNNVLGLLWDYYMYSCYGIIVILPT